MAILVTHKNTQKTYVLLGTGYGAYLSSSPSFFGGNLFPNEDHGEIPVAAVSNYKGEIEWFLTEELQVIEVDGNKVEEILKPFQKQASDLDYAKYDYCPACGEKVSTRSEECPECGIRFIDTEE